MGVTIIKGRSGSGKSRYLKEHIRRLIKDPLKNIIVITAGSQTFETERSIIESCNVKGILGLQVLSIQRLAYALLEGSAQFMTNADKAVVCKKALLSLGSPFHGAADTPDFTSCLASLMTRLKDYSQTPESLRSIETNDEALRQKLSDTADVLETYNELCGSMKDTGDMYMLAAQRAHKTDLLFGAQVIIDGMDSYSPSVMMLIQKTIELSDDVMIAFRSKGSGSEQGLFSSEESDMERFIDASRALNIEPKIIELDDKNRRYSCSELAHLEQNLYSYPYEKYNDIVENIQLLNAKDVDSEVDMITAAILSEAASGKRYRDMAIVAGNLGSYIPILKMKLEKSGIPFFIDERRALSDNTFFDFLHKSLLAAAGDALYVPSYVFSSYSPLSDDEQHALRRYVQFYSFKGWHFYNEFWRGDDAKTAEALRIKAMQPLLRLSDKLTGNTHTQIKAVKEFLSSCSSEERLSELCSRLAENGMNTQREYFEQINDKITAVLDGISGVFGDMHIAPAELIELVKTGCEATKIAIIPPSTDEVGIFDISVARLKNIDVLFASGVQDGVWPSKSGEPGILSEAERQTLFDSGVDLGITDLNAEKLKVYTALVKPKDKLYISYNDASAPSVLIDRIKRIFPELNAETETAVCSQCTDNALILSAISESLSKGSFSQTLIETGAHFIKQTGWKQHTEEVLQRTNAALSLEKETAIELYGGIKCSATRIENYYQCPFAHFISRGIKAQPYREYVGDSMDTGSFLHLALDIFAKQLLDDSKDIKKLSENQTTKEMELAADSAAKEYDNAKLIEDERFSSVYPLLKDELIRTAQKIRTHFINTQASIYSSEQVFSDYTVNTIFGYITITGKIDRIDSAGSYFRVVDYKSSSKTFSLNDFASGTSIQLPVYIGAAKRLLEKDSTGLLPAGGYYMQIGEGYAETPRDLQQNARLLGISLNDPEVLRSFSDLNENGSFVSIDQRMTSKGELHGTSKNKFFTQTELENLLQYTDDMIRKAAEGIYSGKTDISPVDEESGIDVCRYCEYKSVCQKDEGYSGSQPRQIQPLEKSDLEVPV